MHLISLAFLRFVEYMSAVYIDEEFGDLYQPEDPYDYWKRQVTRLKHFTHSLRLLYVCLTADGARNFYFCQPETYDHAK